MIGAWTELLSPSQPKSVEVTAVIKLTNTTWSTKILILAPNRYGQTRSLDQSNNTGANWLTCPGAETKQVACVHSVSPHMYIIW